MPGVGVAASPAFTRQRPPYKLIYAKGIAGGIGRPAIANYCQEIVAKGISGAIGKPTIAIDGLTIVAKGIAGSIGRPAVAQWCQSIAAKGISTGAMGRPAVAVQTYQEIVAKGISGGAMGMPEVHCWTPLDLAPTIWLDSALDVVLDEVGTVTVAAIGDQSGNGRPLVQATKASQFVYVAGGSWPWISGPGTTWANISRPAFQTTLAYTWWSVRKLDAAETAYMVNNGSSAQRMWTDGANTKISHDATSVNIAAHNTDAHRVIAGHSGLDGSPPPVVWVDGSPVAMAGLAKSSTPSGNFMVGNTAVSNPDWNWASVGAVDRLLSTVEFGCLARWLAWKYPA